MSNDLMKELGERKKQKERGNADELARLVLSVARDEAVDTDHADQVLELNGVSLDEFQRMVALTRKRIVWADHVSKRPAAQARVDELQKQIEEANDENIRQFKEREAAIRKMLDEKHSAEAPVDMAITAEGQLRETFPGRQRLAELRLRITRGDFATAAEKQELRAEVQALEAAELLS